MAAVERALPLRQAIALGLLQGPTELLPVSSSAHLGLLPWLRHWPYDRLPAELRKGFEVALHTGAALALGALEAGELAARARRMPRRGAALLALSTAPPALAGLAAGRTVERRLGGPRTTAAALVAGSVAMALADAEEPGGRRSCDSLRLRDGLALGLAQAAALVPGVSRSGATLATARARGFSRSSSQTLSRAVAPPVMFGASLLQGLRVVRSGRSRGMLAAALAGLGASFCSTLLSALLLRRRLASLPLLPFALYRCVLALAVIARARRAG